MFKKREIINNAQVFREIVLPMFTLNNTRRNEWFLTKSKDVCKFEWYDNEQGCIFARRVIRKKEFYATPISSVHLDIYLSDGGLSDVEPVVLSNVTHKIFAMPLNGNVVFAPLRHSS